MSHQGRKGMGSHKHGISGHATKSPQLRHWMKTEAEKCIRQDHRKIRDPADSVRDLFSENKRSQRRKAGK